MPTETRFGDANKSKSNKDTKIWRGVKQDTKSGKFIVYITESREQIYPTLEEAVDHLVEASYSNYIKKEAGSPEYSGVERGQKNLDGVKQVQITRKLVQDSTTGDWKVKERRRYDVIKQDAEDAKSTWKNINEEKEEAKEIENPFDESNKSVEDSKEVEKESSFDKEFKLEPLCKCSHCGASIFPPNMDYYFDRQNLADVYCPACGYGLDEMGNTNWQDNTQSVDNLIKGYK